MTDRSLVYLDFAATTPVAPEVRDAMAAAGEGGLYANPASAHAAGRRAAARVEAAREQLAALLNVAPARLVWTSGATEANNLAIIGSARHRAHRGHHLVTMTTEHAAVRNPFRALAREGFDVTWLAPEADGRLAPGVLEASLRPDTQLVSVMHVNNETGVIQDIEALGRICRRHDVLFHTDAAQSVGKLAIDLAALPVDLLSVSAHKFYGPQGVGALYVADRPGCHVEPLFHGGGQEHAQRPGTLPLALIAGFGEAAAVAAGVMAADLAHCSALRERLWNGIAGLDGLVRVDAGPATWPGILCVSAPGLDGDSLLHGLEPVCAAQGAACNAASGEPSAVLRAMGLDEQAARAAVRFSFGRTTTENDIDTAVERYRWVVNHLRAMLPAA